MNKPPPRSYSPIFTDDRERHEPFGIVVRHTCSVEVMRYRTEVEAGNAQTHLKGLGYTLHMPENSSPATPSRYIAVEVSRPGHILIDTHTSQVVKSYQQTPQGRGHANHYLRKLNS